MYIDKFVGIAIQMTISTIPEVSPEYFIIFTQKGEFDSIMNLMKGKCLQFVNSILIYFKKNIGSSKLIQICDLFLEPAIKNLTYVIEQKYHIINKMEKDGEVSDNNYEFFLYEIFLFFIRYITKDPVVNNFVKYVKP